CATPVSPQTTSSARATSAARSARSVPRAMTASDSPAAPRTRCRTACSAG
ncbi:MAG: hypothetical protein AVDCRST_MAG60-1400, partial [uncultured Nocardioides sp.]